MDWQMREETHSVPRQINEHADALGCGARLGDNLLVRLV